MTDDEFFDRLRGDAAALRHEIGDVAAGRISARIRERLRQPTVIELLVAWLRPVAVAAAALATAALIALSVGDRAQETDSFGNQVVEISMAGDTFHVGD